MHQYKIEVFRYESGGSVGGIVTTRYADNPEQARLICAEYDRQYQTDESGESTGLKAFQVRLYTLCYKICQDKAAFFAQFEA